MCRWYTRAAAVTAAVQIDAAPVRSAIRGPVVRGERALAPDLARGAMLLFIALANAAGAMFGGPGHEQNPEGVERTLNLFMFTAVHARAYPVFALMFGYGLVQLASRQRAAGAAARRVRTILLRRNVSLVGLGFLHAALLYFGDFLAAYGVIGMFAAIVLLPRTDRFHRIVLWLWAASALHALALAILLVWSLMDGSAPPAALAAGSVGSLVATDYISSLRARLLEWLFHTATVLPAIVIVWLGMWAARRRVLEDASAQRPWLRAVAAAGLAIAFLGGLPLALNTAGFLRADSADLSVMFLLHQVSGMFGGPGYVACIGLIALRLTHTPSGRVTAPAGAIAALGQRSLSGYLFQSVAWLFLLSPYTLDLGRRVQSPMLAAMLTATLVWLTTVFGAALMERRGYRGPAETLLRRLTYGRF